MAAAVGNDEPYNFSQTSCKFVQKRTKFSGTGLYISKMSSPAEKTVFDDCFMMAIQNPCSYARMRG